MPATRNVYLSDALNDQIQIEAEHGPLTSGKILTHTLESVIFGEAPPETIASKVYALLTKAQEPVTQDDVAFELNVAAAVVEKTLQNLKKLSPRTIRATDLPDGVRVWHLSN